MSTLIRLIAFLHLFHCWKQIESAVQVDGAGASFPSQIYNGLVSAYRYFRMRHLDVQITYESVGSGKGIQRIKGTQPPPVNYAGSDSPLTAAEQAAYPDLRTFPTMAGAIVLAYRLPGVTDLILNLEIIVGIYNGTIRMWNNSLIQKLNLNQSLPNEKIIPIARADNSGTSEGFTSGLSDYSTEWKNKYGIFSVGLNQVTSKPYYWNDTVVKFFGRTNQGMSGLILSLDFSIGYLAISDAYSLKLDFALLQNKAGNIVNASLQTVQNAITSANMSFNIMNMPGKNDYPLAIFTYFVVRMTRNADCNAMVEFVRYVDWCFNSVRAHNITQEHYMVPLDPQTASFIVQDVLKHIMCNGKKVWPLMTKMILDENIEEENTSWRIPTYICVALLLAVCTAVLIVVGKYQYKIHKELLKDAWHIQRSNISLDNEVRTNHDDNPKINSQQKFLNITDLPNALTEKNILMGTYAQQHVSLIRVKNTKIDLTLQTKRKLLWIRDNIQHQNVFAFIGLTQLNGNWYHVHSNQVRGTLTDILQNRRINLSLNGIISLSKSLVRGLVYLHRKGIVHGQLNGMSCMIDSSWNLRIAEWVENNLINNKKVKANQVTSNTNETENINKQMLWTAPEVIKYKRNPSAATDVYSLAMVFQEMFTRNDPYCELNLSYSEVINAVLTCGVRPTFVDNTPRLFRAIMERSWEVDPEARPTVRIIEIAIKGAYPDEVSFLDCIIDLVEQYSQSLEKKVKDYENDINNLVEEKYTYMYKSVPVHVAKILHEQKKIECQNIENVALLALSIAKIDDILAHVTLKGFIGLINSFVQCLDQNLQHLGVYKLDLMGTTTTFIIGIHPNQAYLRKTNLALFAATTALKLKTVSKKFGQERLFGLDTSLSVKIGIACGSVIVGVLSQTVPQYVAIGEPVDDVNDLVRSAEPDEIRMTENVYNAVKDDKSLKTRVNYMTGVNTMYFTVEG